MLATKRAPKGIQLPRWRYQKLFKCYADIKGTSTRSFRFLSVLCWQVIKSIHLDRKQIASLEILSHYCWLKPYGGRHVWSSFNEGSDNGEYESAPKRLSWWFEPALGLSILVTLATDPLSLMPCSPFVPLRTSFFRCVLDGLLLTTLKVG